MLTAPSFATFTALVTGLVANTGAGTVTGMLTAAGPAQSVPHNRMHRFFARGLEQRHARPVLVPPDRQNAAAGRRGADGYIVDTVFKKRGRKVHSAAWRHDGGARGEKPVGYGVCFVLAGIIVELPFCSRPFRLPVAARLWRPKSETSKVDIAAALVKLIALWHREARVHVVADATYHAPALRHLPARITVTTRLAANAVLYDLPPPPTGKRGRSRLSGLAAPPGIRRDQCTSGRFGTASRRRR